MSYRIQPSAQAETDIDRIFNWLSERSPDGAARGYESFWDGSAKNSNSSPRQKRARFPPSWFGPAQRAICWFLATGQAPKCAMPPCGRSPIEWPKPVSRHFATTFPTWSTARGAILRPFACRPSARPSRRLTDPLQACRYWRAVTLSAGE